MPQTEYIVSLDTLIAVNGPGHSVVEATSEAEAIAVAKTRLRQMLDDPEATLCWLVEEEELGTDEEDAHET